MPIFRIPLNPATGGVTAGASANHYQYFFMNVSFDAIVLSEEWIPLALPLVQATWPAANMKAWQSFVRFYNESGDASVSGVLGLQDQARCLCGIMAYRLDRDLLAGPILTVPLFTAIDVANSPHVIRALLNAAESRAVDLGCSGIRVRLGNGQAELASRLRAQGLSSETGLFWRKVNTAKRPN